MVLNCSVLSALEHLCKSNHESIRKEACWTVSNIAAGNKVQIQVSSTLYSYNTLCSHDNASLGTCCSIVFIDDLK